MAEQRTRPLLLLIDSDSMASRTRGTMETLLEDSFEVFAAVNGAHALSLFPKLQPDIVLMVSDLVDVASTDVCARMRSMPGGPDTPIVVLLADDAAAEPFFESGATDFIPKSTALRSNALISHRLRFLVRSATELRNARESATRLARAQFLARLAQWELVPETGRFRWSDEVTAIFGIPPTNANGGITALLRWVHPDDRMAVANAVLEPAAHRIEYRLVLPDGRVRTIHQEAELVLDENGTAVQMIGAAQDITELRAAERQVRVLAYFDSLTRLPNRAMLQRFLERAVTTATSTQRTLAVLAIDLDGFKRVNDTLGHGAGDVLLREVGARLTRSIGVRTVDTDDDLRFEDYVTADALVARLGGDEFVVVLERSEDPATVASRIRSSIAESFMLGNNEVFISSSIGIASLPENGTTVAELLERADAALYTAKERGRNNFQFYTSDLLDKAKRRMAIESGLRGAMIRAGIGHATEPSSASTTSSPRPCDFHLLFQPKVEIPSHRMVGVEALIRWTSAELGFVSPAEFIPIAEDAGLIVALGEWVLRTACEKACQWMARPNAEELKVSVNVSARQFREPDFASRVAATLKETGLPPRLLELEITEGVVMQDTEASSKILDDLKQLGVRIALDDFGTGYSSLSYLTKLPIDALKIDRSFVRGLGIEAKSATITSAIIALSRGLAIDVVVEGVETEEQLDFVARHGSAEIQGFLFARPMSMADLAPWSEKQNERANEIDREDSGLFNVGPAVSANANASLALVANRGK